MSELSIHNPIIARLYTEAVGPAHYEETDRIVSDMKRYRLAGRYDPARTAHSFERFVVEPSAIALTASQEGAGGPWFKVYGREVRAEVARRLVRVWERELGADA